MHYSNVILSELKTYESCDEMIEKIETDYQNVIGGFKAFNSGYQIFYLKGAVNKIEAIRKKQEKIFIRDLKVMFKEFQKKHPDVSWDEYYEKELYC